MGCVRLIFADNSGLAHAHDHDEGQVIINFLTTSTLTLKYSIEMIQTEYYLNISIFILTLV